MDFNILLCYREQLSLDLEALRKGYEEYGGLLHEEWVRSSLITDLVNVVFLLEQKAERPRLIQQLIDNSCKTMECWNILW